jgi:hypothetical protein
MSAIASTPAGIGTAPNASPLRAIAVIAYQNKQVVYASGGRPGQNHDFIGRRIHSAVLN